MTDEELDRLEKLAAGATPGPWYVTGEGESAGIYGKRVLIDDDGTEINDPVCILAEDAFGLDYHNAPLIAASREAIPALIAEVRRLKKALLADFSRLCQEEDDY